MNWTKVILAILFIGVVGLFYYIYENSRRSHNQLIDDMQNPQKWRWIKSGATIAKSDYDVKYSGRHSTYGDGDSWFRHGYHTTDTSYKPILIYKYTVGGKEYTGSEISPNGVSSNNSKETVLKFLSKYPVGQKVSVIYSVKNPSKSYLNTGSGKGMGYTISVTCIVSIIALAFFYKLSN